MAIPPADLDDVLAAGFVDGLDRLPLDDVRARRTACDGIDTALSYLRRLVQGRLDIIRAELRARAAGHDAGLAAMVERLPEILAPGVVGGGSGRLASRLEPPGDHRALTAQLDRIVDAAALARLPERSVGDLESVARALQDLEGQVSAQRRALHDRLDVIQAEIVRRYGSGEASVDSLL